MNVFKLIRFQLLFILFVGVGHQFAQEAPAGYYDSAEGLTGEELKAALNEIISGHVKFPYSSSSTDTWDVLKETDKDPNNPNNVILLYTGASVDGTQEFNNGNGWNREHVWAKSRGDFGTAQGPGTDVHALRPANIDVNSHRGNRWFGYGNLDYKINNELVARLHVTNFTWEPRDEIKGDVARMIFYMATRYEGKNGEPDLEVIDYFPSNKQTTDPVHAKLSALLEWHELDPVDDRERNRNHIIYTHYQKNRNPFIDRPEFVAAIWGESSTSAIDSYVVEEEVEAELVKIVDMLGREVEPKPGVLQLYIYSDGNVVKKIIK